MAKIGFLSSFRVKLALVMIASMFFAATLGNFYIFKFAVKSQFNQLRDKLKVIAQTAALSVDADQLLSVPLDKEGINSQAYKAIAEKLTAIKKANFDIKFIYTMSKAGAENILQFIVDPDALTPRLDAPGMTSYPGDKYDASAYPEMLESFNQAIADQKIDKDQWGSELSAYAPIRDKNGFAVAILGVDITADDVYLAEKGIFQRGLFVLFFGIIFSLSLGVLISRRITEPVKKLVQGTKYIAAGNLDHRVDVKGNDEFSQLAGSFNIMAESLNRANRQMRDYFSRSMQSLVRLLEAKDPYTKGHSDRVTEFSRLIGQELGLSAEKMELLTNAAQLHDIGKLCIDERILNKPSALTDEEFELIRQHPQRGLEILKPAAFSEDLLKIVRSHHERYDGKGYPDHINGELVDLIYQIIPVADSYDAMTSSRSYRPAMSKDKAVAILKESSGSQFNPLVVQAFLKVI
ncbi:MAG: HD-GYP domain-containing protein [Candidatus Omnitrophica bacterium]|jgi:putative nucleotidyltransferase with HDIG domain|nr:HD-GYP domain-containing protein [Candidatus Omnitrophota bacterium]